MQAHKEAPPDLQCKDKFLVQSVVADDGATTKDITAEMVACYNDLYFLLNHLDIMKVDESIISLVQ